jgi:hypothetical protein
VGESRFVGGLRTYPRNSTTPRVLTPPYRSFGGPRPLAELFVDDQHVRLRVRWSWLRRFVGYNSVFGMDTGWQAPRERVSAEEFRGLMWRGVLLRSPGLPPAVFWCSDQTRHAVLAMLQAGEEV